MKTNFLNDKGHSKNPVPYFMFFYQGEILKQFSADGLDFHKNLDDLFILIKEINENPNKLNSLIE